MVSVLPLESCCIIVHEGINARVVIEADKEAPAMEPIKFSGEGRREGHSCEGDGCKEANDTGAAEWKGSTQAAVCPEPAPAASSCPEAPKSSRVKEEEQEERYTLFKKEMEEKYRLLMEDKLRFTQYANCQERERLRRHIDILNAQLLALNQELNYYQQNCRDLSLKIERAEHLHSQQSMADRGSYQDSAATPPLLQHAVDTVKDAITVCASELLSRIKKNSLPVNLSYMNMDPKGTGQMVKVAWQNFLCHIFFKCFEDPFFFLSNDIITPFDKPAKQKTQFLQAYKRCRDLDAGQMRENDADFAHFFDAKASEIGTQLKEQVLLIDDAQRKEDFISLELRCVSSSFYGKLLRLAKAVWVLHKLAFAFEPIAEIFRVGQNSILDEEFMEDIAEDIDDEDSYDDDDERVANAVKYVRFMCVPGFTVRHTIVKSRVFSLKEILPPVCDIKPDPSPMALE